ncbi:hypothetical protein P879_11533 [Paragonimus westermani]|uniref:Uncharacterized protein n=1 Tax=Paragonimus westermani TaxID=34504 RepID=A0A8T0D660_9TREM|nr:hypothetical protein P879_11533 [Paragonimus westermani]
MFANLLTLLRSEMLDIVKTQWQRYRNLLPRELRISSSTRFKGPTDADKVNAKEPVEQCEITVPAKKRSTADSSGVGIVDTASARPHLHCPSLLSKTTIKCLYTNAQCLINKLAELVELCRKHLPHLIAVTEIWFQPHISDNEVEIIGMSLLRRDRIVR